MLHLSVRTQIVGFVAASVLLKSIPMLCQRNAESMSDARQWVAAKVLGQAEDGLSRGCLMVYNASGSVLKNGIGGHSFRIADKQYDRGLNLPLAGAIKVHLPRPGKSLEAVVGVDSNDLGYYSNAGRGSVVASVEVLGREAFRSAKLHEGMVGVPVKVDLVGATEFTLELKAFGPRKPWDDPAWDQADWADARVTLADGSSLWLADLPVGPLRQPYTAGPPFSFRYGGHPSTELLETWESKRSERRLDENRTEHTATYSDPRTGLIVRSVTVVYHDFPTVEWTLYFKNTGTQDTPILEDIQALDTRFERNAEGEFILHHSKGSPESPTDYEPFATVLEQKAEKRITALGGRPTNSDLCYFNLEWPGEGVIIALGWPGQWAAEFKRDEGRGLRVRAGQELTHFKLLPGEEVRSPLVALQVWKGDWIGAQNIWRRWMIAHNVPRPGRRLPPPQTAGGSGRLTIEMQEANEENQKAYLDQYLQSGLKLDYWWMDAGWYLFKPQWWSTGTWEPDPERFPHGLRPIADYAHAKGVKIIVWFEPERVTPGSWLYEKHPDWLLGQGLDEKLKSVYGAGGASQDPWTAGKLLYLGNTEALQWAEDHFDKLITKQGIDLYREDFNFDPLPFWRANDAEDRQGITEIRHVTGHLAYWDELQRRHPNMLLDTCASGGRRNDLETLRRAVPLWRSDYAYEPTAMQNATYGIALWIPYFGTAINSTDPYVFRSQMTPAVGINLEPSRKDIDYEPVRRLFAQWQQVSNDYYGDYYPLTPYRTENDVWMAWQFDRPEEGDGMVQVFRRPHSPFESARFRLRGLGEEARYGLTNPDVPGETVATGNELMKNGLAVVIKDRPGSVIVTYRRVKR